VSRRRALVSPLPGDEPTELSAAPSHHLLNVLRLQPGAALTLFDGAGRALEAELIDARDGRAVVEARGPIVEARPSRDAHLVLGLIKPKALDLALRMGVEAGLTHVHLFVARRSQGRPPREDRWERIAEAAATQCGRADIPTITWAASLEAALDALPPGLALYVATPGAHKPGPPSGPAAAVVGPEGGLADHEMSVCERRGAVPLGLAAWTLRAETAAALAAGFVSPES
jgi:16S rRNA (uracil1498-N3)-methyltransferase